MKFLQRTWFFPIFCAVTYFATRLLNLLNVPIFTDEAIYSYWAQIVLHDPANRFISLEDGKQPLFIWFAAISQRFIADPLVAGRFVSILAGFFSTIGIYLLARELFGVKVAKVAALLYIFLPFTLLYDRLALYDSLLTTFSIFSLYLTVKMAKTPRLDLAMLNGIVIGLGLMTKSSAIFFIYLLPFSLILFSFSEKTLKKRLLKWVLLSALTVFFAEIMYNALRVSPLFYLIDRKNHDFIRTFHEVFKNPSVYLPSNPKSILTWLAQYSGAPFIFSAICTIVYGFLKKQKSLVLISIYFLAPFVAESIFNKVLYPRFALFYYPFVIVLVSFAFIKTIEIKRYKAMLAIFWLIVFSYPLFSTIMIPLNPIKANLADSDKGQFINGWPAGYGVSEIRDIIKKDAQTQNIYVGTEGTFGLLPFALKIYFYTDKNVEIVGFWPVSDTIPKQALDAAKNKKTYFVFNENQKPPDKENSNHLKLVAKYQKGAEGSFMRLYEISP